MMIDPERTVRVSRVIPARREAVFRAWTDPELAELDRAVGRDRREFAQRETRAPVHAS